MKTLIDIIHTRVAAKPAGGRKSALRDPACRNTVRTEKDNSPICTTTYNPYIDAANEAIAERIALCWNACLGIPNDELRKRGV